MARKRTDTTEVNETQHLRQRIETHTHTPTSLLPLTLAEFHQTVRNDPTQTRDNVRLYTNQNII